ncbi:MAG: hypothetical protein ACKPH7_13200 [Planktothrix sp.]|uniref:hypothetical protein n=1 Tax=Planktothrix sp. TaxID=3088171 RepID=UPI0038D46A39
MKKLLQKIGLIVLSPVLSTILITSLSSQSSAQNPALQPMSRDTATRTTTNLPVWPGRFSVIDFSQTDEIVTYIRLADPSKAVFNTDIELKSNQARMVLVQPIQPLNFPGATTTSITNLVVKTRSSQGVERLYLFNIIPHSGQPTSNGIAMTTGTLGQESTVFVDHQRVATLQDIEQGLKIAIQKGYTPATDPIVFKVREFLTLVRNGMGIPEASTKTQLSMPILISLGKLGLEKL